MTLRSTPPDGAGQGDEQPLREVLRGELPAPGAERDAHRRFARARDRARQQQPGGVRARDQKQQPGRREQQQQRRADVLDDRLAKIEQAGGVGGMADRILRGDLRRDALHVRLGRGERDARLAPRVGEISRRRISRGSSGIQTSVRTPATSTPATGRWNDARHHAGHGVAAAVERQRFADDAGIGPSRRQSELEITTPVSIAEPLAEDGIDAELVNQRRRDPTPWTWCGSPANVRFLFDSRNHPNASNACVRS